MRLIRATFGLFAMLGGFFFLFFAYTFVKSLAAGHSDLHAALVWVIVGFPTLLVGWLIVKWGWQFVTGQR